MKTNNVIQFPVERSKVYRWTKRFIGYYLSKGPGDATKFLTDEVPQQFYRQVKVLAQRELLRRGITN